METFAKVIKKLYTIKNQSPSLEAFLVNHLIPLNKNPGLRPIGVGKVLGCIAEEVIVSHLKEDVIQAMRAIYKDQSAEAVLLKDTSNAYNSINRNVFLHNAEVICPPIARYVKNC